MVKRKDGFFPPQCAVNGPSHSLARLNREGRLEKKLLIDRTPKHAVHPLSDPTLTRATTVEILLLSHHLTREEGRKEGGKKILLVPG